MIPTQSDISALWKLWLEVWIIIFEYIKSILAVALASLILLQLFI